jgi:hypothetical protein
VNYALSFLAALLGSWLDPVLLSGGVLAGWWLRPRWLAVLAAVVWNFLVYSAMLVLAFRGERHAVFYLDGSQYLGSCLAAVTAALFIHHLRAADREHRPSNYHPAWGITVPIALPVAMAAWVTCAQNFFYHYYDVYGRPCYWERANFHPPYWAMDYPRPTALALLAAGAIWAGFLFRHRAGMRTRLFPPLAGLYGEFLFWAVASMLHPGKLP